MENDARASREYKITREGACRYVTRNGMLSGTYTVQPKILEPKN